MQQRNHPNVPSVPLFTIPWTFPPPPPPPPAAGCYWYGFYRSVPDALCHGGCGSVRCFHGSHAVLYHSLTNPACLPLPRNAPAWKLLSISPFWFIHCSRYVFALTCGYRYVRSHYTPFTTGSPAVLHRPVLTPAVPIAWRTLCVLPHLPLSRLPADPVPRTPFTQHLRAGAPCLPLLYY